MKTHTDNLTIIRDQSGNAAFIVLPIAEYEALVGKKRNEADYIPGDVVERVFVNKMSMLRAWREHLGLTQQDVAQKMGITQSAYSKLETKQLLKKSALAKAATALGINLDQLDF